MNKRCLNSKALLLLKIFVCFHFIFDVFGMDLECCIEKCAHFAADRATSCKSWTHSCVYSLNHPFWAQITQIRMNHPWCGASIINAQCANCFSKTEVVFMSGWLLLKSCYILLKCSVDITTFPHYHQKLKYLLTQRKIFSLSFRFSYTCCLWWEFMLTNVQTQKLWCGEVNTERQNSLIWKTLFFTL